MAEMDAIMNELRESGELVSTEALADPSNTKTVRMQSGVPVVTDGPLAEAKEHFGGYLESGAARPAAACRPEPRG